MQAETYSLGDFPSTAILPNKNTWPGSLYVSSQASHSQKRTELWNVYQGIIQLLSIITY